MLKSWLRPCQTVLPGSRCGPENDVELPALAVISSTTTVISSNIRSCSATLMRSCHHKQRMAWMLAWIHTTPTAHAQSPDSPRAWPQRPAGFLARWRSGPTRASATQGAACCTAAPSAASGGRGDQRCLLLQLRVHHDGVVVLPPAVG